MARKQVLLVALLVSACGRDGVRLESSFDRALGIEAKNVPEGRVGQPYRAELVATGESSGPFRWSLSAGALPDGLLLDGTTGPTRLIQGTPTSPGERAFRITLQSDDETAEADLVIVVRPDDGSGLEWVTRTLGPATKDVAFEQLLIARGGSPPYSYALESGALPPGYSLIDWDGQGRLSGITDSPGLFRFVLVVRDQAGTRVTRPFTLAVENDALRIQTSGLASAVRDQAYDAVLVAAGGSSEGYGWSLISDRLPQGLVLGPVGTPSTHISGTPTESGLFPLELQVIDSHGNQTSRTLPLTVVDPEGLAIVTEQLPNAQLGWLYQSTIQSVGGVGAHIWSISLAPPGLRLASGTGAAIDLGGTPGMSGNFSFSVSVSDQSNQTAIRRFMLHVDEPTPLQIDTTSLPPGRRDEAYAEAIYASGGVPPYSWIVLGGALPPVVTVANQGTPATIIVGTPQSSGDYAFTLGVQDATGASAQADLLLHVWPPLQPLAIVSSTIAVGLECVGLDFLIAGVGGSEQGYNWSVTQGALPPGVVLEASGTPSAHLRGAPTQFGSYQAQIQLVDDAGNSVTWPLRVVVAPNPNAARWIGIAGSLIASTPGLVLVDVCSPATPGMVQMPSAQGAGASQAFWASFSPDRAWFAFLSPGPSGLVDLFVTRLANQPLTSFTLPGTGSGEVKDYRWSPDGSQIALRGDLSSAGVDELYVVTMNPAPSMPRRVSGPLIADGDVAALGYQWSPDGRWLAYQADQIADEQSELFAVEVANGNVLRLNATLPVLGRVASGYGWLPDSSGVLYVADQAQWLRDELWFAAVSAGPALPPIRINGPLVQNGDVRANSVRVSADGAHVAYLADQQTDGVSELFLSQRSALGFSPPTRVNPPLAALANVDSFLFSPDSARIAYVADQDQAGVHELYVASSLLVPSGPPTKKSGALVAGGDVSDTPGTSYVWSAQSDAILYLADASIDEQTEAYFVPLWWRAPPLRRVGSPRALGLEVETVAFSGDGLYIVVRGDLNIDGVTELFVSARPNRLPAPLEPMHPALVGGREVSAAAYDLGERPDQSGVYYRGNTAANGVDEVWFSPFSPSSPPAPMRLHPVLTGNGDALRFVVQE